MRVSETTVLSGTRNNCCLCGCRNRVEVAYREAVALKRQEELIREEEAAGLAETEHRAKREAAEKEKRSKKKQVRRVRVFCIHDVIKCTFRLHLRVLGVFTEQHAAEGGLFVEVCQLFLVVSCLGWSFLEQQERPFPVSCMAIVK